MVTFKNPDGRLSTFYIQLISIFNKNQIQKFPAQECPGYLRSKTPYSNALDPKNSSQGKQNSHHYALTKSLINFLLLDFSAEPIYLFTEELLSVKAMRNKESLLDLKNSSLYI